jgi:hypothetical protein
MGGAAFKRNLPRPEGVISGTHFSLSSGQDIGKDDTRMIFRPTMFKKKTEAPLIRW